MADFKTLNGYAVKDNQARTDIANILEVQNGLKSNLSNPNLLINSDFRNPVNQRGASEYAGADLKHYTIDRWATQNIKVTVNENSVTLKNTGSTDQFFSQKFEGYLPLETYTLTCEVLNIVGEVWCYDHDLFKLKPGLNVLTLKDISTFNSFTFGLKPQSSIDIAWCKLEHGAIATPFTPRPYEEELALCKRFYQKSNGYEYFGNVMSMGYNVFRILSNYQDFRTVPTVKVPANTEVLLYNRTDGQTISTNPVISEVIASDKGMLKITAPYASGASVPIGVVAIAQLSKELEFDAEIY